MKNGSLFGFWFLRLGWEIQKHKASIFLLLYSKMAEVSCGEMTKWPTQISFLTGWDATLVTLCNYLPKTPIQNAINMLIGGLSFSI